ncbi:MAG: type II toxin-antitoxin system VapC family toxin [Desulfobacteraceae bacterium]
MSRRVFVDASGWIALIYAKDSHHKDAAELYKRELEQDSQFFISNWTIYEAFSMIKKKAGIQQAEKLRDLVEDKNIVAATKVDSRIEAAAVRIFWDYQDKNWGIVDITSLLIMRDCHCQYALAFDQHFREAAEQFDHHFEVLQI